MFFIFASDPHIRRFFRLGQEIFKNQPIAVKMKKKTIFKRLRLIKKNGLTKNKKLGLMTLIFKIFGNFTIKNMKKYEKRITFFNNSLKVNSIQIVIEVYEKYESYENFSIKSKFRKFYDNFILKKIISKFSNLTNVIF